MDYLVYNLAELPPSAARPELLPPDELAMTARRGASYPLIRTLLRQELSRRTEIPAQEITFHYTEHGKPEYSRQCFNLSHSGDCLCLAFHHTPVGVDVERMRPRSFETLAARFMCEEQLQGFIQRGCPQDEFYACWCTAEALVKQKGDTMWHARSYPFLYRHGRIECLFSPCPMITIFTPMPGYCGVIAY